MSTSVEISCAIWHPFAPAELISGKVNLTPVLAWSRGETNPRTGGSRDRTYCKFYLGEISSEKIEVGIDLISPFEALREITGFFEDVRIVVYFTSRNEIDLHLNKRFMTALSKINAEIEVRFIC